MQVANTANGGGKRIVNRRTDQDVAQSIKNILYHQGDREDTPFGLLDRAAEAGTYEKPGETTYLDQITREAKADRAAQTGQDLDQAIEAAQRGEVVRPSSWAEYETGVQDWSGETEQFAAQSLVESEDMDGARQDQSAFDDYQRRQSASIARLQQRANLYQDFFDSHRDAYGDDEVNRILSTLNEGAKLLNGVASILEEKSKYRDYWKLHRYEKLRDATDFTENSQYRTTANGRRAVFEPYSNQYQETGFDDPLYDYINRNPTAQTVLATNEINNGRAAMGRGSDPYEFLSDDETSLFNYIYATQGKDSAYDYLDLLRSGLTAKQRAQAEEQSAEFARKYKGLASAASILASPARGLSYIGQAADYLTDGEIDQNAGYNRYSYIPTAIQKQRSEDIGNGWSGEIGSFLYNTGMSTGDFLLNAALTGGLSGGGKAAGRAALGLMGAGAAADTVIDKQDQGYDDTRSFVLGTVAGLAEIATEKFSLEALLDKTSLGRSAFGYFVKNFIVEGSEEGASDLLNWAADELYDVITSQSDSEWKRAVREKGFKAALLDQAKEIGLDMLGGALSGGLMSGAQIASNSWQNRSTGNQIRGLGDDVVLATIQEGLDSPQNSRSYRLAKRLQNKLDAGKALSGTEVGRLYQANVMQIDSEGESGPVETEAEEALPGIRPTWDTDAILRQAARDAAVREMAATAPQEAAQAPAPQTAQNAASAARTAQEGTQVAAQAVQESPPALRVTPLLTRGAEGQSTQRAQTDTSGQQRAEADIRGQRAAAMENASALVRASEVFGENGQKAFAAAWDGRGDSARYYAGFSTWYQAGLDGKAESQVRGPYARAINEAQRVAAYDSGRRDAELSLAREKATAPYARTAGTESGLYDAGDMDTDMAGRMDAAAKALGVRVHMVDDVAEGRANGQYSGSDILIAKDAENPHAQVFGHEITHRVQELAPEQYRAFRQAAVENLADSAAREKIERYREQGMNIRYEAAMDDVAADYAGQLLEDGAVLDQFIERHRTDRTLLERLRDVFRGLWEKLTGAERRKAKTAEGKLTAALDAAAGQAKSLTETGEGLATEETDTAQYSLKGSTITKSYNQLLRENDALRERVEYWRGQTRTTKEVTTDRKSVEKTAKSIAGEYGAQLDIGELSGRLQALYNHMARTWYANGDTEGSDVWNGAEEIARDIAESSVAERSLNDEFPGLKERLRDTPITIGREYDNDIRNENFRREYRGKLKLSAQGTTNVDAVYTELSESYPSLFPEDITHPADQMEQIMDVADSLHTVEQQSRFSGRMEEAVTGITNEIVEQFMELPLTKGTFADWQAMKLDKLRSENREAVRNAIAKEREARDRQVTELKEKYKARTEAGRERQSAADLRRKITRHAKSLSDKLLHPTDKAHIPEELRGPVARVLESINLESQYTIDPETGKRTRGGGGDPVKRTQAFMGLKQKYADINKNGGDLVIDPALLGSDAEGVQGSLDAVIAMGDTPISAMNSRQLSTVWQVLKSVEHSVSTAGKLLSQAKYERTSQWADALRRDTATRRDKRTLTKGHMAIDLENPYTFFSHFGQAGQDMYRTLRDAQDRQQVLTNRVADETAGIVDEKTAKKLEKATHDYTTESGQKLTLSTAQVMELYELSKRKQAQEHLLVGGIVQPEIRGTKVRRGTEAIHLTVNDLSNITGTLTAEEKGIADGLQRIASTVLSDMGNEASMAAYGYKKFAEPDYWPIRSAREALHSNIEKGGDNTRSIKNIGMAQATKPHANNQVDIGSIFDTFARHTGDMVDYAAWLVPMEDLNRVYNYQYRDGEGNPTGKTVKGLLDAKGGEGAQKYWHDLMEDIQNGIKAKNDSPIGAIASKGVGAFKGAAVGGNIRVIIQQPTAFFRAAAVLNPADMSLGLTKGATKGNGWKKALQYSPIAMRKDAGGFDISAPGTMKETLFGGKNAVQKVNDALSWGAGKADAVTWGKLWNACEWQVARQHKELKKGSRAFYEEVNRVFTDMIDQTQVVDGILQRSNIMRSSNAMVQQATSFMGEPIMSLNLTMRAWDQLRNEQDSKKRGKAIKNLSRAATALTVTAAVNALAQSLIDGLRDDDKDKKYWERFWSAFNGQSGEEETNWDKAVAFVLNGNMGQNLNPVGQIPYAKDVLSILQGYDVSRTELSVIEDLIEAGQTFAKSADGTGPRTIPYALNKLIASAAKIFGLPAANLERDVWAAARSVVTETGNLPLQYEMEKAIYNIGSEKNKSRFEDIMYRALESGDIDTYTHVQGELMEQMGLNGKEIESAMQSRYKANLKEDPNYTLDGESYDLLGIRPQVGGSDDSGSAFGPGDLDASSYLAYATQRADDYRTAKNALSSSPIFKGMDQETQDAVLRAAYDLAQSGAMMDNGGDEYEYPSSWLAQAPDVEAQGIEPWEYALWRGAQSSISDTKGADGKTVKGESKKDHLADWLEDSGLSAAQQAYLWGTAYTTDYDEYRNELAEYRSYGPQMDAVYSDMSSGLDSNPIFAGMDAELKEKVTDAAMEASKQMAKMDALDGYEYETQWISKTGEAEDQGISPEDYVMWHVVCGNTYSDRDANGDEIPGRRKQDHLRAWLRGNDTLTESQKLWLWRQQYKSLPF